MECGRAAPRRFTFTENSRYKALLKGDGQFEAIARYRSQTRVPVRYLMYNPVSLPYTRAVPALAEEAQSFANELGCRVIPAEELHLAMTSIAQNATPRYADSPPSAALPILPGDELPGWRLEDFIANLVIQCRAGYVAESRQDTGIGYVFSRRDRPISAALATTIEVPQTVTMPGS